jgi:anaerobic dimethyl sulfoxide reductase subunit A
MLIAMAEVIVSEGLHDQAFLDRCVLGFDEAHLPAGAPRARPTALISRGAADGVRKTPEWAEPLTGVPAATIRRLAREFAAAKPAALQCRLRAGPHRLRRAVPPRRLRAHRAHRQRRHSRRQRRLQRGARASRRQAPGGRAQPRESRVASPLLADLLARGRRGRLSGRHQDRLLGLRRPREPAPQYRQDGGRPRGLDFMVAPRSLPHPTARFADIVLPATTFWERNDVHTPWSGSGHYVIYMKQAIEPMGECRNDRDICADLARVSGCPRTTTRPRMSGCASWPAPEIDDWEPSAPRGWRVSPRPPSRWPSPRKRATPSRIRSRPPPGKIEIYSAALAANPDPCGSAPSRPSRPGSRRMRRTRAIRCSCVSPKSRARTHSTHDNPAHPVARGSAGRLDPPRRRRRARHRRRQPARVFNDRGATVLPARVTDRIAPGVVSIKEGALVHA